MGEIIKRKIRRMNWKAKIAIILCFTLIFSTFMYEGWYKPKPAYAAVTTYKGTFTKRTSVGAQSITGVGFQPKAVIFFWTKNPTNGTSAPNGVMGIGFAGGSPIANSAVVTSAQDNVGTTNTGWIESATYSIVTLNPATPALAAQAYVTSFDADGFTLNWQTADTQADIIHFIAIGGTDITNVKVGQFNGPAATGNFSYSGVGFQPDFVMLALPDRNATTLDTVQAAGALNIGMFTSTSQGAIGWGSRDGQTTISHAHTMSDANSVYGIRRNAADQVATFVSMDPTGFTLNYTTAGGSAPYIYIALKGGQYRIGSFTKRTSAGTQAVTGVGFQPTGLMLFSHNSTAANGTVETLDPAASLSIGAASGANVNGTVWMHERTIINTDVNMISHNNLVMRMGASNNGITDYGQATLSSFDAAGFTLNWSTSDATARRVLYLAMGNIPGDQVNVGDGTDPANYTVYRNETNKVADSFTMVMNANTGSVTGVTASLTNPANVSSIRLYRDSGTIGSYDGTETLLATVNSPTATVNFTGFTENLTTTPTNYLIVADISSNPTVGQTVVASVTGLTVTAPDTQGTITDTGTTLTIGTGNLTIGNGTDPANANAPQGSTDKPIDSFTAVMSVSTGTISSLTLTTSAQFTAANVSGIKLYRDAGTIGAYDSGVDVLVPSTFTIGAGTATINITTPEDITTTAQNYLITVDIQPTATIGNTLTARVTSATGSYLGTPAYNDSSSATLTITAPTLPSTITSCAGCHGYTSSFNDGTARNNPAGTFPGSHNKHVVGYSKQCSVCHVTPATETSADFNHRNGYIQIANPINGNTGASYSKGTSFLQTNTFTGGTCSSTYCHSDGTSVITGTIPANTSPAWGGSTTCQSCHGAGGNDDGRPNYPNGTPKRNTHGDGVSYGVTHKAEPCTTCHTGVSGTAGSYTITDTTTHNNGVYNLQASLGYNQSTGQCATPGCHGAATWGGTLGCTDCHANAINSPVAQGLGGPTQRRAIVPEFAQASSHKRSAGGSVTNNDCGVCHMEGTAADGSINTTYHKNGYVELRDPDTGGLIEKAQWTGTGAGSLSTMAGQTAGFVRFSRNLGTHLQTDTNYNVLAGIELNHCLKCHDAGGAASTLARVPGGSATAPFGGTGTPINVSSQFATTNRSYHPVLGKQNNSYAAGTRMNAPWNITKTAGTTTSWGYLMTCWDCHAPNGATGTLTATVTAHGSAKTTPAAATNYVELRGSVWMTGAVGATNNTTLCIVCHAGYDTQTASNHGTGSAITTNTNNNMSLYLRYACYYCHTSGPTIPTTRLDAAADVHGSSTRRGGTTFTAVQYGYGFIRSEGFYANGYLQQPASVGGTAYSAQCTGFSGTNGSTNCARSGMGTYSPGGTY